MYDELQLKDFPVPELLMSESSTAEMNGVLLLEKYFEH